MPYLQNQHYDIVINDLKVICSIGIYPEEYVQKQPVLVSLRISALADKGIPKNKENILCYDTISRYIADMLQKQHHDLVEDVIEKIASYVLSLVGVERVWVSVMKPDAIKAAQGVGIEATFVNG